MRKDRVAREELRKRRVRGKDTNRKGIPHFRF